MEEDEKTVEDEGTYLDIIHRNFARRKDSKDIPNSTPESLEIKYDRYSNRAIFRLLDISHELELSPILSDILSIKEDDHDGRNPFTRGKTYKSTSSIDLNRGNRQMYVYCSIIEESIVGDSRVPLLRSFPLSGKAGSINESFNRIYYAPLKTLIFDNIEIELRNEVGQLIQFQYGHSNCVLHFRRVAPHVLL